MKIVIDIPEKVYTYIQREWKVYDFDSVVNHALNGIKNGTPLPKGHGDLIDRKELLRQPMDLANYPSNYVRIASTIVEADAESDAPNFESEEYVEERIENYNNLLKSGILDCVMEKPQESEGKE